VHSRVDRWLERAGLLDSSAFDALADEAPLLSHSYATSIRGQSAIARPRSPIHRMRRPEFEGRLPAVRALQAHDEGFDLHAGVRIAAQHPEGRHPLEKLLRYCARPPIADDRLTLRPDGHVVLTLKTPWHDGTTHLDFDPIDFLARCAALIPRPHKNLVVYHGVLSAHARLRPRVIGYSRPLHGEPTTLQTAADSRDQALRSPGESGERVRPAAKARRRGLWADLMRRAFGHDLLRCPRCGGKLVLLACILDSGTIGRILRHVGLPTEALALVPARGSPIRGLWDDDIA
jgi:hypothetical protein